MSDVETGKNPDNSTRQPFTGWKLWWRLILRLDSGSNLMRYYKDSMFSACPACGSSNVMVTASRKGHSYLCLELNCRSGGPCEIEGSSGVKRRKAKVRDNVYRVAFLVFLLVIILRPWSW